MILVDTSIWIRFLSGREPYLSALRGALGREEVLGHELVFGELLVGDRGGPRTKALADYDLIDRAATISHDEVVAFVRARRLAGKGIGWIDCHLLASAMTGHHTLWTADSRFAAVAKELGIEYSPS